MPAMVPVIPAVCLLSRALQDPQHPLQISIPQKNTPLSLASTCFGSSQTVRVPFHRLTQDSLAWTHFSLNPLQLQLCFKDIPWVKNTGTPPTPSLYILQFWLSHQSGPAQSGPDPYPLPATVLATSHPVTWGTHSWPWGHLKTRPFLQVLETELFCLIHRNRESQTKCEAEEYDPKERVRQSFRKKKKTTKSAEINHLINKKKDKNHISCQ